MWDEHGVQQWDLRGLHVRGSLHANDRVPHRSDLLRYGDVGLPGNRERRERNLLRVEQGLSDRELCLVHGRRDLHASGDDVPGRDDVVRDRNLRLRGDGQHRERDLLRNEQGLSDGQLRLVHGRRDLHAPRDDVPDRGDVLRHGSFRLRGDGERDEWNVVWQQQGLQWWNVQQLHPGRQLHPEQPVRGGGLHLSDRHRDLPGDGPGSRRDDLRDESGVPRGNLCHLHCRRDLFDRRCVQTLGDDLLHDGQRGLCGLGQRVARDALRSAAVVHGRRGDAGSGLQCQRELPDTSGRHLRLRPL